MSRGGEDGIDPIYMEEAEENYQMPKRDEEEDVDIEEEDVDIEGEEEEEVDIEEENEEVEVVDVDEEEAAEPQEPSSNAPGTDDPLSPSRNSGEYSTAAASGSTHLNSATSEVLAPRGPLSPASHHPLAPFVVSPRAQPIRPVQNTSYPRDEEMIPAADVQITPETTVNEVRPTAEAVSGTDEFEVTMAAGVQIISSKMVDGSATQEVLTAEIKQADLISTVEVELESKSDIMSAQVESLNDPRSKTTEPLSRLDDKSPDAVLRRNSIQYSNLKVVTETQNGNEPSGLRNKSNLSPSDAQERNLTGLMKDSEQDVRTPGKRDSTIADTRGGRFELAQDERPRAVQESEDMSDEKGIKASSSSSKHDPHAFAGLTALTSAIDSVNAREALAQLQPKLDNGIDGAERASGEVAEKEQQEKTELEREMELFEAAEREEEARLLASMRSDQSLQVDSSGGTLKDMLNDRKRASESAPNEARKKRGKRVVTSDDAKEEEDVCFICFDGGDLVLCDRRTCPKAYHLNCIGRDAAFFEKKGAWICGWHFCSICTKPANFQCYTCPTAYCSGCLDKADFLCVRQRKGLCEECWPIVKMIENKETVNAAEGVEVDFSDQETYECLFKEYWEDLKLRLALTPAELDKDSKAADGNEAFLDFAGSDAEDNVDAEDYNSDSGNEADEGEDDPEALEEAKKKKRRGKSKAKRDEEGEGDMEAEFDSENEEEEGEEDGNEEDIDDKPSITPREFDGWASKELVEFVKFMDEDPKKPLSRFQVTKLLWSYIKSQKLQDPRKKTQILCDDRLQTIFGKKAVGQFEMFKHLQSHFAPKGGRRAGRQFRDEKSSSEIDGTDADGSAGDEKLYKVKDGKDKRRGRRKADEDKFERPNIDEFAAVTPKNIGLIYLRRQLLEELLDDPDFDSKVCNTFVRIRVPGMISKSEMCYRLVQIVGTRLQAEHYKAGRKVTNYVLEILNLQKREDVTVDLVSNHEFNEEECQRLRQSIKCGFIKTLTVGDVEEKARSLQEAKVNDMQDDLHNLKGGLHFETSRPVPVHIGKWFETERQRLVNLRDRASEKGRKKELRECVEKLQELNSPAFRAAKLHARPEVTADPRMDPNYESDGNDDKSAGTGGVSNILDKNSSPGSKTLPASILKSAYNESSRVDWDGQKSKHATWGDTHRKEGDRAYEKPSVGRQSHYYGVETASERGYEERDRGWGMDQRDGSGEAGWTGNGRHRATPAQKWNEKIDLSINVDTRSGRNDYRGVTGMTTPVFDTKSDWAARREPVPPAAPSVPQGFQVPTQNVMTPASMEALEKEKTWHYMDPTGTVQGPFSMEQLRKWNTTGYFPEDLRIWKASQARDESILLTDALAGRFQQERDTWNSAARVGNPVVASIQEEIAQALTTSSTLPFNNNHPALKSGDGWRDNGGASSWAELGGSGDVGRSGSWGLDGGQSNRTFARDVVSGPNAPFRDTSTDMKWKPGPATGNWDTYGKSSYSSSPTRSGRVEAAARFDPSNWAPRTAGGRPDRDGWGASPATANDVGGYSKSGGRSSWGRGSNYRDSGGSWNADESGGHERDRSRSSTRASRKDIPCRFHQKGYCKRGDSCDFWHG